MSGRLSVARRLGLAGLATVSLCPALAWGRQIEITYLANEGVLLRSDTQTVIVDGLFGRGLAGYAAVAEAERARLERAESPYDAVTLVLATHRHPDHFDAGAVARFLAANPRAHFLSTPQAVADLRAVLESSGAAAPADRVHASLPPAGSEERHELGGVPVRVLPLHHGAGSPTQNLGFLIEIGGARVLHVGDTEVTAVDLAPHQLDDARIDVALLPVWFYSSPTFDEAVRALRARRLVAFHVAVADAPAEYHGPASSFDELVRLVGQRAPEVELLTRPGQRVSVAPVDTR